MHSSAQGNGVFPMARREADPSTGGALRGARDLLVPGAAPATTTEIARWIEKSDDYVRDEIAAGNLKAIKLRVGRGVFLVGRLEAVRYLTDCGLLP